MKKKIIEYATKIKAIHHVIPSRNRNMVTKIRPTK